MMDRIKDFLRFLIGLRPPKVVYKALLSMIVLLVLFVTAGVAYAYFTGKNVSVEEPEKVEAETVYIEPFQEPTKPTADAPVGASVQALTTPVPPGSNATVSIQSLQGAECDIVVEYDDVKSTDSGLVTKPTDKYGMVSWTWTVEPNVPEGEWPVTVTCHRNDKSGMVIADLEVKSQ